ncbi:tRNA pseudouridine(55) synthase TruB [Effusibacillus lacus]|nr:tRNA pseudouridine(55) synthase TruB [Effusibacillus lacus]
MTSQQVVGRIKRILGVRKVGHTGTLDPDVDGVLPICIGHATRVAEYMLDQNKTYIGEVTFGFSTDTQDASGEVLEKVEQVNLTEEQIVKGIARFVGEIEQVPPAFSAVKIGGKRAYDLARKGESVSLPPRKVTIYSLQVLEMNLQRKLPSVRFLVECSKGTYVRTLCHDLGQALGVPAHMSALTRTKSGPFSLEMAHTLEEIEQAQTEATVENLLLPLSAAVEYLPVQAISDKLERRVINGMEMHFPAKDLPLVTGSLLRIQTREGKLLAIYRVVETDGQTIRTKPEKVFKQQGRLEL